MRKGISKRRNKKLQILLSSPIMNKKADRNFVRFLEKEGATVIILQSNQELKTTYEKLIRTMGERVEWNGRFIIVDNYLILQGEVRSLFFHFENRKVASNIVEFPEQGGLPARIEDYPKLTNIINMTLYAFGKWGTIKGIRVEQDYQQLNQIFTEVLKEYYVEPAFTRENYRFYKEGIRITYEDMVQLAIDAADRPQEVTEDVTEEEQGLWHKLIWQRQKYSFQKVETTLAERQKERLGHNFYQVGYLCPKCGAKLQMVVYPVGKEQKIETNEGSVYLARAYTCDKCTCFYTPTPERLLVEGSIYEMSFGGDRAAYEDYFELLGEHGERTSNYNYNEYAATRNRKKKAEEAKREQGNENERFENADAAWLQMEAMCRRLAGMPEQELGRFLARIEDGFYPDVLLERHEKQIAEQVRKRREKKDGQPSKQPLGKSVEQSSGKSVEQAGVSSQKQAGSRLEEQPSKQEGSRPVEQLSKQEGSRPVEQPSKQEGSRPVEQSSKQAEGTADRDGTTDAGTEREKQLRARLAMWDRLSPRQRQEFKSAVKNDKALPEHLKSHLLAETEQLEERELSEKMEEKVKACEGKPYMTIKRVLDEVEAAKIPAAEKESLLNQLKAWLAQIGAKEVANLFAQMPRKMDRAHFKALMKKIRGYEGVDLTPYEAQLAAYREEAEGQEAANMVNRARKKTRSDLTELMKRMEAADFEPETIAPYMEELAARLREADQAAIDEICGDVLHMDYDEAVGAYEEIEAGNFLPQLKTDALEMLSKRLAKIKTDECEALVQKFKDDMAGKISLNEKHYFYPARKVLMKNATQEETAVIDYALGTYAANRGLFEFPILVVDTSRNGSGREGMILTPEHVFTSTMLSAYYAKITDIRSVKASTGLLNRGIWIEQKNGAKIKVPFAVPNDEIKVWAEVLKNFIFYLQEKPESRKLQYLAKEEHDTICCFRCGHVYKGGSICPECGYKNNK